MAKDIFNICKQKFLVLNKDEKNSYDVSNSLVISYNELVNKGGGPRDFGVKADPKKLKLSKDVTIKKDGKIELDEDPTSRNYLHLKSGTLGANLGAGLFTK